MNRARLALPVGLVAVLASAAQINPGPTGTDNVIWGRFPEPAPDGWDVFVSYADPDFRYWEAIKIHLAPLRGKGIKIFSYDTLEPGATIPAEARSALLTSVAAIFLISARYLASGFMRSDFEKLLDQAEERGVRMLWIRAGTCELSDVDRLTRYQLVCPRANPLNKMREARQDEVYTELVKAIKIQLVRSGRLLAQ